MWLSESLCSPCSELPLPRGDTDIFCSQTMDQKESMTLTTRHSGKCLVPMSIYRALLSLPQTACSVHSKFWRSLSERVSEVTWYTVILLSVISQGAGFYGEQGLWVLLGCSHLLPSVELHFWITLFLYIGFSQTWAWAWGWAGRIPRVPHPRLSLLPHHRWL